VYVRNVDTGCMNRLLQKLVTETVAVLAKLKPFKERRVVDPHRPCKVEVFYLAI
jgi:hypothetical protein